MSKTFTRPVLAVISGGVGILFVAACPFCKAKIPLRALHKGANVCPACVRTVELG